MGTTITTSALSTATADGRHIASTSDGDLWVMLYDSAAARFEFWKSADDGATWSEVTGLRESAPSDEVETSEFYIGENDRAVFCHGGNTGADFYVTPNITTASSWTGPLNVSTTQNTDQVRCRVLEYGNISGSPHYCALFMECNLGGELDVWVYMFRTSDDSQRSENLNRISTASDRFDFDFEHNGNGRDAVSEPNVYIVYRDVGGDRTRFQRLVWNGLGHGWSTTYSRTISTEGALNTDPLVGLFDGTRFVMAWTDDSDRTIPVMLERNAADTTTTERIVPDPGEGEITSLSLGRDTMGNTRLYAVGATADDVERITFDRTLGSFESWETLEATSAVALTMSVQADYQGNGVNMVWVGGGSYNIVHGRDSFNTAPIAATWNSPADNSAQDVGDSLALDWTFQDPDAGDTQSAWALSRSVDGGTAEYWSVAGGSWGASEVKNASTTSSVTLASGWTTDGAVVDYTVKTWDAADEPGVYSAALRVTGSTPVAPVITSPVDASTSTSPFIDVEWTATEQTAYRVRFLSSGGSVLYDSGKTASTSKMLTPEVALADGLTDVEIEVRVWNDEDLEGATDSHLIDIVYVPPATPTITASADDDNARIAITITDPTPTGDQPTVTGHDLYVRIATGVESITIGDRSTGAEGIRIAANELGSVLYDRAAPSGVDFEYKVSAVAASNGTTSDSAWA